MISTCFSFCKKENANNALSEKFNFELKLNDTLKIYSSSGISGYSIKWINRKEVTILDSADYKVDCNIPGKSGCWELWQFKAIKIGIDTIRLKYTCSCDSDKNFSLMNLSVKVCE